METVPAALALVLAGEGLALVPAVASHPPDIVLRPLAEVEDRVEIAACWRRGADDALLRRFLSVARPVLTAMARETG